MSVNCCAKQFSPNDWATAPAIRRQALTRQQFQTAARESIADDRMHSIISALRFVVSRLRATNMAEIGQLLADYVYT
jgi:hypothetical protein